MLSYELCQRLKEAGFPQGFDDSPMNFCDREPRIPGHLIWNPKDPSPSLETSVYCPTLEDLLRELHGHPDVTRIHLRGEFVVDAAEWSWNADAEMMGPRHEAHAWYKDTPEEALCALWLALHP